MLFAAPGLTPPGRITAYGQMPTETLLIALTTFFATIGPADLAIVFAALTRKNTAAERRSIALRGVLIAGAILLFFVVFGNDLLSLFGITLPALRTAGGVLLLLIAIDMVFARHSGGTGTTVEEEAEARTREDISVFPLATPLIAGPGAISATILLITGAAGDQLRIAVVVGALLAILVLTYLLLLVAIPVQRLLGLTGLAVVSRIVGVLLAALAVQFLFDGVRASGLLH
jgi:multiple antibiotic resistance protein